MNKAQVINNYVSTVFSTCNINVDKLYFAKLVEIALDESGAVATSALSEITALCGYSSNNVAYSKIAMLRKMISYD